MARIGINTGSVADDNTGSTLRAAGGIINNNFLEIYNHLGDGTNLNEFTATKVEATVTGIGSTELVRGNMANDDVFRILIGGTASDVGYAEIATADNGDEPIYVRQYTTTGLGTPFGTLNRTLTLLDASGNTTIPGSVGIGTTNPTSKLHVVGVVSATSFSGSGSGLTNIPSGQLTGALPVLDGSALTGVIASGSGVVIKDSGSLVGTAGTIDFGDNLTVSAISAGIVTVTGSAGGGGSSQFVTTAAGIHTLSNVGIGTTNPTSKLQVERYGVSTGFGTFSATAGIATDIDTFAISSIDFKTVEYTLHFTNDSNIQAQKVLVMQNGTTSYSQEYGIMFEPNRIVSIGATFSSGVCKLQATPESGISGLVIYRIVRQGLL